MCENDTEIKNRLKEALELFHSKNYREARRLLENCTDHPLGHKLLMHFDDVAAYSARISDNLQSPR